MNLYKEGLLSDVYDLFTQTPDLPHNSGRQLLENYLEPYTMDDLWEGVLYRLRTGQTSDTIKTKIMPTFFPEDDRPQIPEGVDAQLVKVFRYKFENIIIEFVTKDALDIIDQVQRFFKNQDSNYDLSKITGKQYMGSILKQVDSKKYDIIDKLMATYREFVKESKKKHWQTTDSQDPNSDVQFSNKPTNNGIDLTDRKTQQSVNKSLNLFAKKVRQNYPQLTDTQILDNLGFLLANDNYILKAVGGMKQGGGQ